MVVLFDFLKELEKPRVVFHCQNRRYEGICLSVDDEFLELLDDVRGYHKFLRLTLITDLEVKESGA